MSSFRRINYKLRPAKAIERKMIVDAIRKLYVFYPILEYQYVGFGSIYFVDFALLHKILGISTMTSIEQNSSARDRVNFNKPFSCIEVRFDESHKELPKINLNRPSIIWLDYDGQLVSNSLTDINTVFANIFPGSLFFITVNAHSEDKAPEGETLPEFRLKKLKEQISDAKVPLGIEGKNLSANGLPKVLRTIIIDEINSAVLTRNGGGVDKLSFHQLFNFRYDDGASMLTIGGLLINEKQKKAFDVANFGDLGFCVPGEESYKIEVPNFTNKEIAHLDSALHDIVDLESNTIKDHDKGQMSILNDADILKYAKIYRYYPTFTEAVW